MKYFLPVIFAVMVFSANAQTITSSSLPKAGTVSSYYTALNADYIEISKEGNNQTWDISNVSGGITTNINYENPAAGQYNALYPQANLLLNENGDGEVYYISDDNGLRILGAPMESFLNPGVVEKGNLSVPVFEIKTPMNVGTELNQFAFISVNIPVSIIPDSIYDTLPIKPDSLRFKIETNYNYECTGNGTLKCPGKDFTVLQQIVTITSVSKVEAKLPFLGWQDVSSLIDFGLGLGEENVQTIINFWSPDHINYVAQFGKNEITGEYELGRYTTDGTILENKENLAENNLIELYPNPCTSFLNVKSETNIPSELNIIDLQGKKVLSQKVDKFEMLNTASLKPGVYTVSLIQNGKQISTKKLVKI